MFWGKIIAHKVQHTYTVGGIGRLQIPMPTTDSASNLMYREIHIMCTPGYLSVSAR